jgi:hypothetical protein
LLGVDLGLAVAAVVVVCDIVVAGDVITVAASSSRIIMFSFANIFFPSPDRLAS